MNGVGIEQVGGCSDCLVAVGWARELLSNGPVLRVVVSL